VYPPNEYKKQFRIKHINSTETTMKVTSLLLISLGLISTLANAKQSPNLVIILTDDQGYADVGFNGCKDIPTPHIDTIATNGVRFTNGYATHAVCGPSRAGLLTGRYQGRFGFNTNPSVNPNNPNIGIPHEERNIAEVLCTVGYTSGIVGKWHMGSHPDHHPLNRGFDYFFGFLSGGHDYFPENLTVKDISAVKKDWEWYRTRILHNHEHIEIDDYLTDELTDAGTRFIEEAAKGSKPFCLYLSYNAPHTPLQATEKYLQRFPDIKDKERKIYAAMVSAVDDGVGRVLDTIRSAGIEQDTIIIFLSDNGGPTNNASRNTPLRGHKSHYYEGGIRVPFAMQWKGIVPAGIDYDEPVISLDILATIAGLAEAEIPSERPLDGVNLIPFLTGESQGAPHQMLFWRNPNTNSMAIRVGDMKLVANRNRQNDTYELFNLANDSAEKNNLRRHSPEKADALKAQWSEWNAQLLEQAFPSLGERWW
jgi:arylsulfatase A-like enzyme